MQKKSLKINKKSTKKSKTKKTNVGIKEFKISFLDKLDTVKLQILFFVFTILLFCIVLIPGENFWLNIHNFVLGLFGYCSLILPILFLYIIFFDIIIKEGENLKFKIYSSFFLNIVICYFCYVFSHNSLQSESNFFSELSYLYKNGILNRSSGLLGGLIGIPMVWAFGELGAKIISVLEIIIFTMFFTGTNLKSCASMIYTYCIKLKNVIIGKPNKNGVDNNERFNTYSSESYSQNDSADDDRGESKDKTSEKKFNLFRKNDVVDDNDAKNKEENSNYVHRSKKLYDNDQGNYDAPSIELLNKSERIKNFDSLDSHLGQMLIDTLESFGVQAKIINTSKGPAVTRFELQPAAGVKISKITNLSDDIALNLAATGVRIEAPIPGKAAIGVEIPNKTVSIVTMRDLIDSNIFKSSESNLTVVLGKDISGKVVIADLGKMPHLLIAGSTGSGKSVCINSFIISLLYKSSPKKVKLLMVDPKVVELGIYNGIPHLLVPVVTDPKKAAGALGWAVNEMLHRYKIFAENNVRDLNSYNSHVEKNPNLVDNDGQPLKKMCRIVIIIDELADLMMAAPNEVEDHICRLAQMARAAGMHLVIATQRPSVDVITGIIKANIPSRIALAVSSQVDSRTILDMGGAEKLLGRGDMLFAPIGCNKPIRVQGCYVTDEEIERVINHVKSLADTEYDDEVMKEIEKNSSRDKKSDMVADSDDDSDPMLQEAIKCIIEAGQGSASYLQRKLRLGYARAGRLIDQMEQLGVVGAKEGSKPRKVLMSYQQYLEKTNNNN